MAISLGEQKTPNTNRLKPEPTTEKGVTRKTKVLVETKRKLVQQRLLLYEAE